MVITEPEKSLEKYYEKLITKRPEKINQFDEAVAVWEFHRLINLKNKSDPGSLQKRKYSNNNMAKQMNISRRVYLIKKFIGKNINRSLRPLFIKNPRINHLKLLYHLAKLPKKSYQEPAVQLVIECLKMGQSIQEAMESTGLIKKETESINALKIPPGKVAIFLHKEIVETAKAAFRSELNLEKQVEHFLVMKSLGRRVDMG